MFDHIPVGVGSKGIIPMNARDMEEALEMGMDWSLREGYIWAEDKEHCEEYGRMLNADPSKVSMRAKKRGLPQVFLLCLILFFSLPYRRIKISNHKLLLIFYLFYSWL